MLASQIEARWGLKQQELVQYQQLVQAGVYTQTAVSVPVTITVSVGMDLMKGEDATSAAIAFVKQHGLNVNQVPDLVKALENAKAEAMKPRELVSIDITIDGNVQQLKHFAGSTARASAQSFLSKYGQDASEENINMLSNAIESRLSA
jgi:hypothetical protein